MRSLRSTRNTCRPPQRSNSTLLLLRTPRRIPEGSLIGLRVARSRWTLLRDTVYSAGEIRSLKILVNKGNRDIQCHACSTEIIFNERYVKTCGAGNFHTTCLRDAKGDLIIEPKTELERSRAWIPLAIAT